MADAQAIAEVRAVYEELAQRPLERDCQRRTECCQFKLTGKTPYLTAGESLVAVEALRAAGKHRLPEKKDGSCPLLVAETGLCMIYEDRPFGCRSHFCGAAGGPYTRREVVDLVRRLEDVDYAMGGCGPQTLPASLKSALERPRLSKGVSATAAPRSRGR
ncbi:MAG: YkgJ family cysteine cluster protein [Verrucomicrobia bacterium]|nr:YkgJ family cysteine cluster protein [Verrucomicrobiota bacterium]